MYLPKTETYNFTFLISLKLDLAGKGTSRKVKKWYDLESKRMVAAKKFDKDELALLSGFRGNRGIESPLKYYHCQSVKNKNKIKVIEELYDGALKNDIKLDANELKVVFADVLNGLKVFHQGAFECEYSENKLKNFHQDIKLDNIVFKVDQSNKIVKSCLIDFGSACKIKRILGSPLFFSPEKAAAWIWTLEQKKLARQVPNNALMSHFEKYGQANDLWTLGLVFITLLLARGQHGLNLHRNHQRNGSYYQMNLIINAKQESIDGELRNGRDSQSKDRAFFLGYCTGTLESEPFRTAHSSSSIRTAKQRVINLLSN